MESSTAFVHEPDPDNPGWHTWALSDESRFNGRVMGPMLVRTEGDDAARLRMTPRTHHSNLFDGVHGGVIMALIDCALFATAHIVCAANAAAAVTLDIECRFIGPARLDDPLDAVTQVLRETGRLIFLRGLIEQDGVLVASYSATIRKP